MLNILLVFFAAQGSCGDSKSAENMQDLKSISNAFPFVVGSKRDIERELELQNPKIKHKTDPNQPYLMLNP